MAMRHWQSVWASETVNAARRLCAPAHQAAGDPGICRGEDLIVGVTGQGDALEDSEAADQQRVVGGDAELELEE